MEGIAALHKNAPESHTPAAALVFRAKALLLQFRRSVQNRFDAHIRCYPRGNKLAAAPVVGESKTPLWAESDAPEERFLIAGKIQNLRIAAGAVNGIEIPAGTVFSFWAHVGRASRRRGFAEGRELREGCIVPSVGGGLCQLSNALYDAALKADFEIVERHAHSRVVAGSLAEKGRDATVFWNYIDLRFRAPHSFRIEVVLDKDYLIVKFRSETRNKSLTALKREKKEFAQTPQQIAQNSPNSCATCAVESCFRSLKPIADPSFGRTAFLLDEFSPEFNEYLSTTRRKNDFLFVPLDGRRFRKANYAWATGGFAKVGQSLFVTLARSYKSRKLSAQGAARQRSLLEMSEKLAASYAERIPFDALHVVVQQNLLPFLWRSGALGGRSFDVLMTTLPIEHLQKTLDFASSLHPESKTLGDFRAEKWLVNAETEALSRARRIITPHAGIASLFGERAEILSWRLLQAKSFIKAKNEKFTVVFPASTVGRKGCYELREALRGLDVKLITLGAQIEAADFWDGFDAAHSSDDWLEKADAVVLPAFVEHRPRRLLQAVANSVPVVATEACGVAGLSGVITIKNGDAAALREEILKLMP